MKSGSPGIYSFYSFSATVSYACSLWKMMQFGFSTGISFPFMTNVPLSISAVKNVIVRDDNAVLAEGGAADRKDIKYLGVLPVFNADGSIK